MYFDCVTFHHGVLAVQCILIVFTVHHGVLAVQCIFIVFTVHHGDLAVQCILIVLQFTMVIWLCSVF